MTELAVVIANDCGRALLCWILTLTRYHVLLKKMLFINGIIMRRYDDPLRVKLLPLSNVTCSARYISFKLSFYDIAVIYNNVLIFFLEHSIPKFVNYLWNNKLLHGIHDISRRNQWNVKESTEIPLKLLFLTICRSKWRLFVLQT